MSERDEPLEPTNGRERETAGDDPAFGPAGYLPERASRRARKIVLRAPLGAQWIWASLLAGLLVLVAGVIFLATSDRGPQPPFQPLSPVDEVVTSPGGVPGGPQDVLFVVEGGRPRAFDVSARSAIPVYCEASRRLEAGDGAVWTLTGRGLGGTPSLAEYPTVVADGVLYVDLSRRIPGPPPSPEPATPRCV